MGSSETSAELLKAKTHIQNQMLSFKTCACLKCAIQLGIPDAIHKHANPMTLSQLTASLALNPSKAPNIYRVMRVLVNAGFVIDDKGYYSLTPAGYLLLKGVPLSARAHIDMMFDHSMLKPWAVLGDWFQNDDLSPFETAHGKKFWDYFADEERFQKLFNESMASASDLASKALVEDFKFVFEGLKSLVDVGGGTGTVARALTKTFDGLKCSVLELPHVVAKYQGTENLEFIEGDMFEEIPKANAILLQFVLHDWGDEDCIKILKNCRKAIPNKDEGGKLIVIEMVTGNPDVSNEEALESQLHFDMQMLVLYNAKERSEKDWALLFQEAGFSGYKVFPLENFWCLIEVYP